MNHIPPYPLWLGHAGDGRDFPKILDADIEAVIQLAIEEPPLQLPRELVYCRFPLLDGAGNRSELLFQAVTTLATFIKMEMPTLVVCGVGLSRSPAVAAAALAIINQKRPEEYLELISRHHHTDVSPGFWTEVAAILESSR